MTFFEFQRFDFLQLNFVCLSEVNDVINENDEKLKITDTELTTVIIYIKNTH
jgi:hypothetical protein